MRIKLCYWLALLLATSHLLPGSFGQLVITEFMASNTQTLADEDGDYSDWIELMNAGPTNLNLTGWALTDAAKDTRKWRFPSLDLAPGQTLLVFASNKNRRNPGSPLHTNFRLSASGDYLGLADPSGRIVSDFGPVVAPQLPDISYGIVAESEDIPLIAGSAPAEILLPPDGLLDDTWKNVEPPAGTWLRGTNGLGFDRSAPNARDWLATISAAHPSVLLSFEQTVGPTVSNNGFESSISAATASGGPAFNQAGLRAPEAPGFSETNLALRLDGRDDFVTLGTNWLDDRREFTLSAWIKPAVLNKPRSALWGQHNLFEVGFIDGALLQVSTPLGGTLQIPYPFKSNEWHHVVTVATGDSLRIYFDGTLAIEGGNVTQSYGTSLYPLNIGGGIFDPSGNYFNGFIDEFAAFNRALTADEVAALFQSATAPNATFADALATEIPASNPSVYVRFPFVTQVKDSILLLRLQFDDGFVAFLNGVEVARANAPVDLAWNSAATFKRPAAVGLLPREFDLSASAGLLHDGTNILAIQLLNADLADPDLFLHAELIAQHTAIRTNSFRYFLEPTPGTINGIGQTNVGPLILNPRHFPVLPNDDDPILVTARLAPTFNPPESLSITYRVMFGTEATTQMFDDGLHGDGAPGDGTFGATIPANLSTNGQMVRWYFRATDTQGLTTRWPPYRDPRNSPQYLGTVIADPSLTNPLPVLHWFIQTPTAADSTAGSRCSIFWNGVLYDNVFANLHGQSSQGFPKKSYNFDFNRGFKFQYATNETPVEDINLLTTYPDKAHLRNVLAYETFRDAGHPYHFVVPVRVERNGLFFSDAHLVEDAEEEYLARVGLDPQGALYKMYNVLDSATSNVEKKTRKYESNSDLQRLVSAINLPSTARTAFIYDNVNLAATANYLAAMIITGNVDCCHKNYYLYRDVAGTGEWQFLPWDVDLSFGRNWTGSAMYFDDTMYANNGLNFASNNRLLAVLLVMPPFKEMFLRRVRTLMDELLQAPGTPVEDLKYERRIRELSAQIAPDAALDFAKWPTWGIKQTLPQAVAILTNQYLPARRNYLFNTLRTSLPAPVTNASIRFGPFEYNPPSGLQSQEYFTLVNTNAAAIDLSGWTIEGGVHHTLAPGTVIPSKTTLYLSPDVNAFRLRSASPRSGEALFVQGNYAGQLSARGESLLLRDKSGRLVDSLTYEGSPTPAQQWLRVSEVMFEPPLPGNVPVLREDLEYIVLKNTGPDALDLLGLRLDNGIAFLQATNFFLPPGDSVYLAKNPEAFRQFYGTSFLVIGPYNGQLANEGERVGLYDGSGEKIQDLVFDNAWFPGSSGRSYLLASDSTPYPALEARESWVPSPFQGGTAGVGRAWRDWQAQFFTPDDPAALPSADPDGDGASNVTEFTAGTHPRNAASTFTLEVVRNGKELSIGFQLAPGRQYFLESSTDLQHWSRVMTLPREATAAAKAMFMQNSASGAFYRMKIGF